MKKIFAPSAQLYFSKVNSRYIYSIEYIYKCFHRLGHCFFLIARSRMIPGIYLSGRMVAYTTNF